MRFNLHLSFSLLYSGEDNTQISQWCGREELTSVHAAKPLETCFPSAGSEGILNCLIATSFPNFCELSCVGHGAGVPCGMGTECPGDQRQHSLLGITPGHEQWHLQVGFCSEYFKKWGRMKLGCWWPAATGLSVREQGACAEGWRCPEPPWLPSPTIPRAAAGCPACPQLPTQRHSNRFSKFLSCFTRARRCKLD